MAVAARALLFIVPLPVALLLACGPAPRPAQPTPATKAATETASKPDDGASKADPEAAPLATEPGAVDKAPKGLRADAFGGEHWGFVEASSKSGRLVFLRQFPGKQKPTFGHHGESLGAHPSLSAFDRVTGDSRDVTELIAVAGDRRWFLAVHEQFLWLIDGDSGRWSQLTDVDMDGDANACLPPRHGNFSAQGTRVGWISNDASKLHVRDLDSGETWTVPAKERLWRGWPDSDGKGAVLAEVSSKDKGWPMQRTSCACRWCNRFAMSYGVYGWGGPAFDLVHVAEDGTRTPGKPDEGKGGWHGATDGGCELEASQTDRVGLGLGPWRWDCSKAGK